MNSWQNLPLSRVTRVFHGIQFWVNLPRKDKFAPPRYQAIEGDDVGLLASEDGGALVRVIAGEIDGHRGPDITHTPITLAHATIHNGARLSVPWRRDFNALVYVLSGNGYVGPVAHPIRQVSWPCSEPGIGSPSARNPVRPRHRRRQLMYCF